ncbi:MAG: sodium-dependent transporter [Alistipes sp.]|nr:sodium-dependent transporter [Alistipes sp.]
MEKMRATFGGKVGAVLVTAGSAVGLGNIWRFPYVAGEHGGGAFLLLYVACILLMGLPLMISEFSIGTATRKNAVGAFRQLNKRWAGVGYLGVLSSTLILGFYLVVAGWTAEYMIHSFVNDPILHSTDITMHQASFERFITHPWKPLLYAALFSLGTHLIVSLGVKEGIERAAKVMMPLLFLFLIILTVHSILLPGGMEGVRFFLRPDFSKISINSVLAAVGQAFFSLSIGLGTMITYASYFKKNTSIQHTAVEVTVLDTLVAVLSGMMIFPAVFSAGIEPTAGPSLIFITLPSIFSSMPLSAVWSSIFFVLLVVAALTSTISMHESVTAYLHEEWRMSRKAAAWSTTMLTMLIALFSSLSLGAWQWMKICGLSLFDALDYLTANLMLPAGGLFTCIFTGWFMDKALFREQLYPNGVQPSPFYRPLRFLIRYFCPVIVTMIFLDTLGII